MIARALQPAVEQTAGGRAVALLGQVDEQEGQIVEHVDAGEVVGELDAVEQDRAIFQEHDVGEVEVTVAVAHEAGSTAMVEQRAVAAEEGPGAGVETADIFGVEDGGDGGVEVDPVASGDLAHGGESALVGSLPGR